MCLIKALQNIRVTKDIQHDQYMPEHNGAKPSDVSLFGTTIILSKDFKFLDFLPYKYSNKIYNKPNITKI